MVQLVKRSMILVRTLLRKIGFTQFVYRAFPPKVYEEAFAREIAAAVKPGDVVWDIGANVGVYTHKFLESVGPAGVVVAFEPSPACEVHFLRLKNSGSSLIHVNAALGNGTGTVTFEIAGNPTSPVNRVLDSASEGFSSTVQVKIYRADDAQREMGLPLPTIIKLDVEGFEKDVLEGCSSVLKHPQLRSLFVEVHFGLLAARGTPFASIEIEEMLKASGFNLAWIDASHLKAIR
jgi:FkbM family methyltransferase